MIRNRLHASASLLVLATALATPAFAQDVETVTVTGFRQSLMTSETLKRESTNLVEAISSEDIGKLPDLSIADSLSRLPGLTAQRVQGRDQVIDIRGLGPDFAGTTFNGRDNVSTSDNRGVEFDQYPAEILTGATVFKTTDASLLGQGLSGTVDLKTARPLDYDSRQLALGIRGEYNTSGDAVPDVSPYGKRWHLVYIDQFLNRKLGIAFGYGHLDSPFIERDYTTWWWATNNDLTSWGAPYAGMPMGANGVMGIDAYVKAASQIRDSIVTTLEYQPTEHWHSTLDLYYSNFSQKEHWHGWVGVTDPWRPNPISYSNTTISDYLGTNIITKGTITGVLPVVRNDYNTRVDVLRSAGWKNEFTLGKWTLTADLSYSDAKRRETQTELYAGFTSPIAISYDIDVRPAFPKISASSDFSDPTKVVLWDAENWGHDGRIGKPYQKDVIEAVRFDVKRDLGGGLFDSIEAGANFQTRKKSRTYEVYFATLKNKYQQVSSDLLYAPVSLDFLNAGSVLAFKTPQVLDKYYTTQLYMSTGDWMKDFYVKEKVFTGYAKINLDTDLWGTGIKGNIGGQLIHTDQYSHAFNAHAPNGSTPSTTPAQFIEGGKSYWDFLPSINLVADFGGGSKLRIGVSKTMARARMDQLRASADASVAKDGTNAGTWGGSGGNPKLSPWRSDNIDISFEHYFSSSSYIAVAGFYKNLKSYIYTKTNPNFDFTGWEDPDGTPAKKTTGNFDQPANGNGGYVRGIEVSGTFDGNLIADALDGFGTVLSFSWTDTSVKPLGPGSSVTMTLPGLSKAVAGATLYYEKDGFSFRVAEKYRSSFRGEVTYLFSDLSYERILSEAQTDLQTSYEFQEGTLAGTTILFQVNNLFDTPYRTSQDGNFTGGGREPRSYQQFGRQILLGLNYKL